MTPEEAHEKAMYAHEMGIIEYDQIFNYGDYLYKKNNQTPSHGEEE